MTDDNGVATHAHDILSDLAPQTRALRKHIPGVYEGYAAFTEFRDAVNG